MVLVKSLWLHITNHSYLGIVQSLTPRMMDANVKNLSLISVVILEVNLLALALFSVALPFKLKYPSRIEPFYIF